MGDAVVYAIKKGYRVSQFSPDDEWVEDRPRTTCRQSSLKLTSAYWLRLYLLEWIRNWCCIGKSDWFCCQARGAFYCWKALESFSSTRSSWGTFFKLYLWKFRVSFETGHFRLRVSYYTVMRKSDAFCVQPNSQKCVTFRHFSGFFGKFSKIINLNIREQFQKDVFTSGTDRLKSR